MNHPYPSHPPMAQLSDGALIDCYLQLSQQAGCPKAEQVLDACIDEADVRGLNLQPDQR